MKTIQFPFFFLSCHISQNTFGATCHQQAHTRGVSQMEWTLNIHGQTEYCVEMKGKYINNGTFYPDVTLHLSQLIHK